MADDLTLKIGNRLLGGWTDIRVTRGIERCPNDFEIGMTELLPAEAQALVVQPGDNVEVRLGDDLVVKGYVDIFSPSIEPNGHSIRVIGRGKCQDLVDCAVIWDSAQISSNSVLQIAQKLAKPYKIDVVEAEGAEIGAIIPQFNLNVTDTPWDVIERLCRFRALLCFEDEQGRLVLAPVGTEYAASGIQEGVNVQQAAASFSMNGRFSEYCVFLQSIATFDDIGQGGNLLATVQDQAVPRRRRHTLVAEVGGGGAGLDVSRLRAFWEFNRRLGRSYQLRVTVDSWRDKAGQLWRPNTLVPLDLPSLKIQTRSNGSNATQDIAWLISEVTYHKDAQHGTRAELLIMPQQAFLREPVLFQPLPPDVDLALQAVPGIARQ